jgi:arylsulfatase A-like enzyme/Tfp pilus assembly protein PilF
LRFSPKPIAGAFALASLAVAAFWLQFVPRQHLAGDVQLGRLPRGIDRDRLSLIVVTLDTTRADRLGAYGGPHAAETPVFDRLAREGVLFGEAMTSAPLTLPAHATMFTGQFPPAHGLRDNGGFYLGPDALTLAERLREHGFRTGAFVGAFVLDSKWGLDQGFEHYADDFDLSRSRTRGMSLGSVQRRADQVVDLALPWLETVQNERYFAWLHFYDAHTPYAPPEPYASRYAGRPYDGEVAFADAQLGRVIDFLEQRGLLEKTVVAVLADHGESLGEHAEGTHGFFIYQGAAKTPFAIRAPFERTRARRVADPVRTADLLPTLLALLAVPAVESTIAGVSLVPLITGDRAELGLDGYAEAMYPLHHYGWSPLRALRAGRFKLIDAPKPELYDLEQDPDERHNLFDERLALGQRLQGALRDLEARLDKPNAPKPPAADVDPEVRQRLAALGYVGTFVASPNAPISNRADPKDKIELFNLMTAARDRATDSPEGAFAEVVALLRKVVDADPNVIDAWFNLGNEYYKQRRFEEAIGYFKRALELKPDYDLAIINMANSYRSLGQDEAALAGYEHYLRVDPKNAWVHYQIGEIHMDRGDLDRAEPRFHEAIAIDRNVVAARNALGVLMFMRGDTAAAEKQIRQALADKPDVRLAHFNLGLIAESRGDTAEALRQYTRELELHDTAYRAAFNLGRLHQREGRHDRAVELFRRAVTINPRFAEGHFYLAKAELDANQPDAAFATAEKGLSIDRKSRVAAMAYFVMADVYARRQRFADAERALSQGRALEAALGVK